MQPAEPPPPVALGELLAGKYRVERVLGEGGMGVVVSAFNEALQQRVAIKLLRPGALEHGEAHARFVREARAAASLKSEHVARVLDTGTLPDGRPYIVMEHLEGRDLGDVIQDPPALSVAEAVDYVLQTCEAIAEAHAAGIVHRDLKPRNLFLTRTAYGKPHVKVLDFGISKMEEPNADMQLTKTTEVIGSPSYMSPEQLRSSRYVDHRTDIWALGVILYELLTKRLPFYASTVTELVAVVLMEREPPVTTLRPDVPAALAHAIARCLGKRPEDRFQSVLELVAALEPFGSAQSATATDRVRALSSARSVAPAGSGALPGSAVAMADATVPVSVTAATSHAPPGFVAPPPRPSAAPSRPNGHGGTGVTWSDTRAEPSPARSRRAAVAVVAIAGVLLAVASGAGAIWYVKRASATPTAPPTPAEPPPEAPPPAPTTAEAIPLPSGRKDLPPLGTPSAEQSAAPPPATAASAARAPVQPRTPRPARPPAGALKDDPLGSIGRR